MARQTKKLTMHIQILELLKLQTTEESPMTQPRISVLLRWSKKHGSRALVLNELQERDPHVHKRVMTDVERRLFGGRVQFFWWYDESKENDVYGKPKARTPRKRVVEQAPITLQQHFEAMQSMMRNYISHDVYIDVDGKRSDEVPEGLQDPMRTWMFAQDMIHMMDGPEQRAAQTA